MRRIAVVILAAGKGTRMKSGRPKVLHPLAGRPLLEHALSLADVLEPDRIVVVTSENLRDAAASLEAPRAPVTTVVQEPQLGTGHAVMMARDALQGFEGDVLVLFADTPLIRPNTMHALLETIQGDASVAALGFEPDDAAQYGRLVVDDAGSLSRIVEFADADEAERNISLCNAGLMAIKAEMLFELLDALGDKNAQGEYYLTDLVEVARERGLPCAHSIAPAEEVMGINDRAQLAAAEAVMQQRMRLAAMEGGVTLLDPASVFFNYDTVLKADVLIGPNVVFGPGVVIEQDVEIKAFCHLEGVHIHENAVVGPFARLRPGTEVGAGAKIGNFVETKNAQVEPGAKISHLSYIGDARVGARANIGAGTITCNYDGFRKSHTDIGEDAFIGSNTSLVAPVSVGARALVGAGSVITRDVADDAVAVTRAEQRELPGAEARRRARLRRVHLKGGQTAK